MSRFRFPIKRYSFVIVALVMVIVLASYTYCKRENRQQVLISLVPETLSLGHFSPLEINDSFSIKVFNLYIKHLDYGKRFFTKEDLKKLEPYRLQIDDEIHSRSIAFYEAAQSLLDKSTEKVEAYYKEILSQPFTFDADETLQTDPDKCDFAANDAELKEIWRKALKYEVLTRLNDKLEEQENLKKGITTSKVKDEDDDVVETTTNVTSKNTQDTIKNKTVAELEAEVRARVLKLYNDRFKRNRQSTDMDKFSIYLNAITGVYDPHTQYLAPKDKENFDISMSGQLQGIGAILQETDGYTKVAGIVPGSPSWKQGDLKVGDLILKVAQDKQEPVDIVDMRLDDAVKLIRGPKGTKVTLTVKKIDGTIKQILLVRDVVINEETYAKSAIIDQPEGKIGYIYLPKFYANFENTKTGRTCSEDIAIEIEKLKKENVKGIVFDLRNNTGGSLQDVVKMAGLFISTGPVVQVKTKQGAARVYNDYDPQIQYSGALVFLVNELSASASEILAAAMQDYKRAIIMGTSTFGKGTVQTQVDLNEILQSNTGETGDLGAMLLTIQKFYRINGGATQLRGVTPDVKVPDLYSEIEVGERQEDYSMPWTKINALKYNEWNGIKNIDAVITKANTDIVQNSDFETIRQQALDLKKQKDETIVSLSLKKYQESEKMNHEKSKKFEELGKKDYSLKISPIAADLADAKGDTARTNRLNSWTKDLKKDLYLKEATSVIKFINTAN
jgi:carboxyl-terminal processing protease